jgi:hypothetical protein
MPTSHYTDQILLLFEGINTTAIAPIQFSHTHLPETAGITYWTYDGNSGGYYALKDGIGNMVGADSCCQPYFVYADPNHMYHKETTMNTPWGCMHDDAQEMPECCFHVLPTDSSSNTQIGAEALC